jgi:excisionase family DNA binding protein
VTTIRRTPARRREAGRSSKQPLLQRLVYTIPEAGRLLGLGRNAAYAAAKRGDIPTIRMGRLLRVPKAPFHRLVGAEAFGSWTSGDAADCVLEDGEEEFKETSNETAFQIS